MVKMMKVTLVEVDGQLMLPVPNALAAANELVAGKTVSLALKKKRALEIDTQPRYVLAEMLAQYNPDTPRSPEEEAWLNIKPVGREVL